MSGLVVVLWLWTPPRGRAIHVLWNVHQSLLLRCECIPDAEMRSEPPELIWRYVLQWSTSTHWQKGHIVTRIQYRVCPIASKQDSPRTDTPKGFYGVENEGPPVVCVPDRLDTSIARTSQFESGTISRLSGTKAEAEEWKGNMMRQPIV